MRSLVIANSKERRTSLSGEMVEEEKGWGSLARGGRKASLPVLTSYKRLPMMDTVDTVDTVDSSRQAVSSRESSGSRNKRRDMGGRRDRKSTPSRYFLLPNATFSLIMRKCEEANVESVSHSILPPTPRHTDTSACHTVGHWDTLHFMTLFDTV